MIGEPNFWENVSEAQKIMSERGSLQKSIEEFSSCYDKANECLALLEFYDKESEPTFLSDLTEIEEALEKLEFKRMLSDKMDKNGCFFSIRAGAGGKESCDWAEMLARMYTRWFDRKGWSFNQVDILEGEVGIKSITYAVNSPFAYGYSKSEYGVHRLVRISPYDANNKRHTSFASVEVTPILGEDIVISIKPDEIEVDTFRSSGPGGQHVNTTDSAVRITHKATGIVVSSQKERSQMHNRNTCMKMLESKLYDMEEKKRKEELKQLKGDVSDNSWGHQIRSYVMYPYTLVKDVRTQKEGSVEKVLDGDLDPFVNEYLKKFGSG